MKAVTARGGVTVEWTKKPPLQSTGNCDQVGGDPCHTFTGTFTVKVTPASQYLTLTPSPSSVLTGDSVTFTPNAGGKAYTVWSWTWVPNDGSASLTVCGTATTCRIAAYASGTMYLRAKVTINGSSKQVEQAKAAVTVTQPDLLLQADQTLVVPSTAVTFTALTMPAGAFSVQSWMWIPADTAVAASNLGCAGATCVTTVVASGQAVVTALVRGTLDTASQAVTTANPVLDVQCPATVERGTTIECTASITPAAPFVLNEWRSSAPPGYSYAVTVNQARSAGQLAAWPGVAVANATKVTATAEVSVGGSTWAVQDSSTISILGRSWEIPIDTIPIDATKLLGDQAAPLCLEGPHYGLFQGWVVKPTDVNCDQWTELFEPFPNVDAPGVQISQVAGGPNSGLFFAGALTTRYLQRMQLIRDFRAVASGYWVHANDSVAAGCRSAQLLGAAPDSQSLSIGVVDSLCMGSSGFKHRADSLWKHERCHIRIGVAMMRDSLYARQKLIAVEGLVGLAASDVRDESIALLTAINDTAWVVQKKIDLVSPQKWPTYWGVSFGTQVWRTRTDSLEAVILTGPLCS